MGRLNIIIFFLMLILTGFFSGDTDVPPPAYPQYNCASYSPSKYTRASNVAYDPGKVYVKVRYKASEIRFEPGLFNIVLQPRPTVCGVCNARVIDIIPRNRYITVGLRGPPVI